MNTTNLVAIRARAQAAAEYTLRTRGSQRSRGDLFALREIEAHYATDVLALLELLETQDDTDGN